jgi:hypothetical protein
MSLESPLDFSNRVRLTCLIGGADLRRPIAESLQRFLNLKTMAAGSSFQFPAQFYPSMPEIRPAKRTRRCARVCRVMRKNRRQRKRGFRRIWLHPPG